MLDKVYKLEAETQSALKIKADASAVVAKEGMQGYAVAWLHLTNNQKAHKKEILKIYNDYDNGIYVICDDNEDNVRAVEDYLKNLGLVIESREKVVAVLPTEVFDDDLDTELIDW